MLQSRSPQNRMIHLKKKFRNHGKVLVCDQMWIYMQNVTLMFFSENGDFFTERILVLEVIVHITS